MKSTSWRKEEVCFLIDNIAEFGIDQCVEILRRNKGSILRKLCAIQSQLDDSAKEACGFLKCNSPEYKALTPSRPTSAIPGSENKILVMEERVRRGESAFHPRDFRGGKSLAALDVKRIAAEVVLQAYEDSGFRPAIHCWSMFFVPDDHFTCAFTALYWLWNISERDAIVGKIEIMNHLGGYGTECRNWILAHHKFNSDYLDGFASGFDGHDVFEYHASYKEIGFLDGCLAYDLVTRKYQVVYDHSSRKIFSLLDCDVAV